MEFFETYDAIVLGAGHAGCEAALALSRMGFSTLCLTLNLDSVALMPCNPSIGGTSKGHLVREVDALGGEMGLAADEEYIQMRMLNTAKGPAVHSLRAQVDKRRYHERMKLCLEKQENLTLRMGEGTRILTERGRVCGLMADGIAYGCRALVVATGVYLKSHILIGEQLTKSGPAGLMRSESLSDSLRELGMGLRRFKTGTPARVSGRSVDFSKTEAQYGDVPTPRFSFLTGKNEKEQVPCYLTYTNENTHRIILDNLHRSAMYSGLVEGTGTRYCPSIEDKIMRFRDKERHQLFLEPEGLSTEEIYVQGLSTSLPFDVQKAMLRTIPGLERAEILRPGYAIEYDCIYPDQLDLRLQSRQVEGLFFAGQINGSSGYEEAAAQGLYAGVNAGLYLKNEEPLILNRADAYIGVLVDDLVTKGTPEPYRMMTSRAEYRLLLRQDNADLRLTELGRRTGLISEERYRKLMEKKDGIERGMKALSAFQAPGEALKSLLESRGEPEPPGGGVRLFDLLKRQSISYADLRSMRPELPELSEEAVEQLEVNARYGGYIEKQKAQVEEFKKLENTPLPRDLDYASIGALRLEARQKLNALKPENIGRASRISGVSPADIGVLLVYLKKMGEM